MTVNDVYDIMKDAVAKNIQQGYLPPAQFNSVINQGQRGYLDYLKGEYQQYQVQRPISVVEFGQNEMIRQSLAPLIYGAILPITPTTGISPFPSDHEYADNMWSIYGSYNIKFIQQDRQDSYIHSSIDPIATNPVYLIQHEGFHFFPDRPYGENQARMSYIRTPPSIVWAYVEDGNGLPVYDPFNSQQPVWAETDMLQIIVRALQLVGVSLQFPIVLQYSNEIKQRGQ